MVLPLAVGWGIVANRQVTFVALVALLGAIAAAAPASAWVGAALVAALTFKGLVSLGALPSVATFVDLPLAWGALFVALLKQRTRSPFLKRHLRWLGALALAVVLAWSFNRSEVLRPLLYLALLGEPFAIVGALLADPPSPRMRNALRATLFVLLVVQIPLAAFELLTLGAADHVQGTLYGAGAGAHVVSAVSIVGAIWLLSGGGPAWRGLDIWRLPIVAALCLIPFIADAKQVILALPAIVLASSWRVGRAALLVRIGLVAGSAVALFALAPGSNTTEKFLEQSRHGQGGKEATAIFLWQKLDGDPASLAFGKGPAETVSRAAFMTTDLGQGSGSPLRSLHLKPATIAVEANTSALLVSRGGTSFNSGTSSALGVFGDLGIFGLTVYAGLVGSLFIRLRRETSADGVAGAAGLALFLVLGLVFDWWEQPPLGVVVGLLAGLALSEARASGMRRPRGTAACVDDRSVKASATTVRERA